MTTQEDKNENFNIVKLEEVYVNDTLEDKNDNLNIVKPEETHEDDICEDKNDNFYFEKPEEVHEDDTWEDNHENNNIANFEQVYVDDTFEPAATKVEDRVKCFACLKLFKHKRGLEKHLRQSCKGRKSEFDNCFQCNKCGKRFTLKASLKRHLIRVNCNRTDESLYECYECAKTFRQEESLRMHAKSQHNIELPKVNKAADIEGHETHEDKTDVMEDEVHEDDTWEDKNEHNTIEKFEEVYVDDTFQSDSTINSDKIDCIICLRPFKNRRSLLKHLKQSCKGRKTESDNGFQCDKCGKRFNLKATLKRHKIRVNCYRVQDFPYKCSECDKSFRQQESLRMHAKSQHDLELPEVNKVADIENNGTIFVKEEFNDDDLYEDDKTNITNGELSFNDSLIKAEHVSDLSNYKDYPTLVKVECFACSKTFKTKWYLKEHLKICKGKVDKYDVGETYCDGCDKEFSYNGILKIHKERNLCKGKVDFSPKIYYCDQCDKTFTLKQSLRRHKIIHTDESPCFCDICGKSFTRPDLLVYHVKTWHKSEVSFAMESEDQGDKANLDIPPDSHNQNAVVKEEAMDDDDDDFNEEAAYPAISLFCEDIDENLNKSE